MMMNTRQKILSSAVIMVCSAMTQQAQAALANNAILKFNTGVQTVNSVVRNGITYTSTTTTGSYFSMDTDGNGAVAESEKTMISVNAGVAMGSTQPASGSHSGSVDGTESPGIDDAWEFFGNVGMHQTTSAVTILSDDTAGNVTLDFSGWNVTWNKIASIPMGAGTDNGVATLTCASTCADGDTYTLDYAAIVPDGDPSGFGGVSYTVHLEGTIDVPPAITANGGTLDTNYAGTFDSNGDGRISMSDLTSTGIADDSDYSFSGGLFNFEVNSLGGGAGSSAEIMIPLMTAIPANAVYRKYVNGVWSTFTETGGNLIASAPAGTPGDPSTCPVVTDAVYDNAANNGLIEGYECLHLTLVDGGAYDYDGLANSTVQDPGGIATALVESVDTRTSSTSGCSMSETPVNPGERADWWLVAGFLGLLGWLRLYRRRSINQG